MKIIFIFTMLIAQSFALHAEEANNDFGNPEIEAHVSVCAKEEKKNGGQYEKLLAEPFGCGVILTSRTMANRSSVDFKNRFEKAKRQIYFETRNDSAGISGACQLLALSCIERNTKFTSQEKERRLKMIIGQPQ